MSDNHMKPISDSYFYQQADYGKHLFNYIMSAERVDKKSSGFDDIIYIIKKQGTATILKVLLSNKVELLIDKKATNRAFKVVYAKDVKSLNNNGKKVFIDCTGLITNDNGEYKCKKYRTLLSYLTTAMAYIIYYENPKAILNNTQLTKLGTGAFVDLMLYVFGYLKVPVTYLDNKEKMSYVLSEYYLSCILGIKDDTAIQNMAKKISGIKEKTRCDYLHTLFSFTFKEGKCNFEEFLNKFSEVFIGNTDKNNPKNRTSLTTDAFIQRWMYAYGAGTFMGVECFIPFSQIITDCYNGDFINMQNTIEKVVGSRIVTMFSTELLKVGSENA